MTPKNATFRTTSVLLLLATAIIVFAALGSPACCKPLAPQGLVTSADSSGSTLISWVYPGQSEIIYSASSNAKLKACYISLLPGAHQLACRFVLSPERQWLGKVEIWVEKGKEPMFGEDKWLADAALQCSIAADSAGRPGPALGGPLLIRPADQGIPGTGGYLYAEFDLTADCDTLWTVFTWLPENGGLTRVGVDDQTSLGQTFFRQGGVADSLWTQWTIRNPMVTLYTLRYSMSCADSAVEADPEWWITDGALPPDQFLVSRVRRCLNFPCEFDSAMIVLPGEQTCFRDTAMFAGHQYAYCLAAVEDADTSAWSCVEVTASSPVACQWQSPLTAEFDQAQSLVLPFTFRNLHSGTLHAAFLEGWLLPLQSSFGVSATADSLPLLAAISEVVTTPGEEIFLNLYPGQASLADGEYAVLARFIVTDELGCRGRYELHTLVQVTSPTGILEENEIPDRREPSFLVFPNPTTGAALIQICPAGSDRPARVTGNFTESNVTHYYIDVYDILGREQGRTEIPVSSGFQGLTGIQAPINKIGNTWAPGVYFIRVWTKGWSACQKIVVLR